MSFRDPPWLRATVLPWALSLACAANPSSPAQAHPPIPVAGAPKAQPSAQPLSASNVDRVRLKWQVSGESPGRGVALSRSLGRVAVATERGVDLLELATGKLVAESLGCKEVVRSGVFFYAEELVVVCEGEVARYDVRRSKAKPELAIHDAKVTAASFARGKLALGHHDGVLRVYDLAGGPTTEIEVPGPPIDVKSLALSPDANTLAVAWVQGSVWWWSVAAPGEHSRVVRHENESDSVAFSSDGRLFAEEGRSSFTTVWSVADKPAEVARIKNGAWVKRLIFVADDTWIARGGSDGLELAEVRGPKRVALETSGRVEDIAVDEQRTTVAAVDRMGRLTVWGL